jgi:hypothetical protein
MQSRQSRRYPELKKLVMEASHALARLDAERLEELALSCQALNRELDSAKSTDRTALSAEAREASRGMVVLASLLDATRANYRVMNRLMELHVGRLEYSEPRGSMPILQEIRHGNN